jgi:2-methylisocitrate lyase-like PEP mutase family enzyme
MQPSQSEKATLFRSLHEGEPFVIPNPWDIGSAKLFSALGFQALATTSSGFAFTLGLPDGGVTLGQVVEHIRAIDAATALPVSADLENGFGSRAEDAARAISRAAEAGAVGGSIEDFDRDSGIYEPLHALERVAAAVEAAARFEFPFTFTARTENQLHGNRDLEETISRLQSFERAGADVLFAPGLRSVEDVRAVCAAVTAPVNVLGHSGLTLDEIVSAGAQRISVGGGLAFTGLDEVATAARAIQRDGDFSLLRRPREIHDWLAG